MMWGHGQAGKHRSPFAVDLFPLWEQSVQKWCSGFWYWLGAKKKKKDKSTTWMRYVLNSLHRNKSTSTVGNGARLQKLQVIPSEPLKMQTVTKIRKCITRCKCLGSVASRWVVMWCQSPTVMAERGPALLMAAVAPDLFLDWWPFLG